MAEKLKSIIHKYDTNKKIELASLYINKQNPLSEEIQLSMVENLQDKVIVVVDDVANTGKTMFYAFKSW